VRFANDYRILHRLPVDV